MAKISNVQTHIIKIMVENNLHLEYQLYWWKFVREDGTSPFTSIPGNFKSIKALEKLEYLEKRGLNTLFLTEKAKVL